MTHVLLRLLAVSAAFFILQGATSAQTLPAPPGEQFLAATAEEMQDPLPAMPPLPTNFGEALAMDGRTLLVGMPAFSASVAAPPGAGGRVAVFTLSVANQWVRSGSIDPVVPTPGDRFGNRVALDRGLALVGSDSAVFVFKRRGETWKQIARLTPSAGERYNGGLAVSDGALLIGVSIENAPGKVYVFAANRHGTLHRVQKLHAWPAEEGDGFGAHLATSRGTLVVGADGFAEGQGAVFVYQQFGRKWFPYSRLTARDQVPATALGNVSFGAAVAVSNGLIAVGAPGADRRDPMGQCEFAPSGAAYIFARRGWRWILTQKVDSPNECAFEFGATIAISHNYLVRALVDVRAQCWITRALPWDSRVIGSSTPASLWRTTLRKRHSAV